MQTCDVVMFSKLAQLNVLVKYRLLSVFSSCGVKPYFSIFKNHKYKKYELDGQ